MPDLVTFRQDLAILLGGLVADLVVGDGRASAAGARDLRVATQYAFDALVLGGHWPDRPPAAGDRSGGMVGALAETILSRTFVEIELAAATAVGVVVGRSSGPGSTRGA